MSFLERLQHGWNAFKNKDPSLLSTFGSEMGLATTLRPDRTIMTKGNEKNMVTALYNKIAVDVSAMDMKHVKLDPNNRYIEDCDSGLNYCLTVEANKDQTGRAFIQDAVLQLFDEGCIAIVPVDTDIDPLYSNAFDVKTLRVGRIMQWYPDHVRVRLYNDRTGNKEERNFPKKMVAIIENPFYTIMNEPNSVVKRLIRKMNLMDVIDEQNGSGKMNIILQLPYVIKTDARRVQAQERVREIEAQMMTSKYGIAYADGTEKIIQLNRSLENNLFEQIEFYTNQMYSQLGIDATILNGTADESTKQNYTTSVLEPVASAIRNEIYRKFLSKTARTQRQSIMFFSNPFRIIPPSQIPDLADKLTRNEIMTSNEVRQIMGLKPSSDPEADELRNKNLNKSKEEGAQQPGAAGDIPMEQKAGMAPMVNKNPEEVRFEYEQKLKEVEEMEKQLDELEKMING